MGPEEASAESELTMSEEFEEVAVHSEIDPSGMDQSHLHDEAKHKATRNNDMPVNRGPNDKLVQNMGRHVFHKHPCVHHKRKGQNIHAKVCEDLRKHCEEEVGGNDLQMVTSDRITNHAAYYCSVTLHRHRNAYHPRQVFILLCQHERVLALCGRVEPQQAKIFEHHEHFEGDQVPSLKPGAHP